MNYEEIEEELNEVRGEIARLTSLINQLDMQDAHAEAIFNAVLNLVEQWQKDGRTGHCLPVIRAELLDEIEEAVDRRRRNDCESCGGLGHIDAGEYDMTTPCLECQRPNA